MACYKEYAQGYPAMGNATSHNGMTYGCSWPAYLGDDEATKPWGGIHAAGCSMWRAWTDVVCEWSGRPQAAGSILDHFGNYSRVFAKVAGRGLGWNDPDNLVIGNGCITPAEEETQMALFSILAAPLIMGNDARDVHPARSKATLLNAEATRVNQDPLGAPARSFP